MKDSIVNELITAMKDRLPPGQNLANFLTDTLCIGREAVYRRLRGEVAFTIDEVAQISYKLGISIDQIIGNHLHNRVTFDMNLLRSANAIESYYEIIDRYLRIFDYVKIRVRRFVRHRMFCLLRFIPLLNICLSSVFAAGYIIMDR